MPRRHGEAALLGHGDEVSDLTEIHNETLLIVSFYILDTWSAWSTNEGEVLLRRWAGGEVLVAKIEAGRRVSAAGQRPRRESNRFRSDVDVAVKNNSGNGSERQAH